MCSIIRKLFRNSLTRKVRSIKNEQGVIRLFEEYLLLNQTTKDEVVGFLRNNHISIEVSRSGTQLTSPLEGDYDEAFEDIFIFLAGPPVWDDFILPYDSQYQVRFLFTGNILSTIKATHIVYHF